MSKSDKKSFVRPEVVAFLAGLVFALGLGLAGMTRPGKVIAFLDFFGDWDPSLAFVMGGGVVVYTLLFRRVVKREQPVADVRFRLPTRSEIDWKLVTGAALFGVGWGLGGFCPGPALTSLIPGGTDAMIFVASMLTGMGLFRLWDWRKQQKQEVCAG